MEYSDYFSDTTKIENEDDNEEESFMEQSLPCLSYTLDLSFHNNRTEKTSCGLKPTLKYVKVNGDNSVVTNSDSPWDLASNIFPRSLERILNNCGVGKAKSSKNVAKLRMNIKKKTLVENKNVYLVNDQKTSELKDKSASQLVTQFATRESDMLKKYKEKTKSPTDIQVSQNKYGENENVEGKNVDCLVEENIEEDKSLKQNMNKRKQEKLEEIPMFETNKTHGCQKKKRNQLLQGSFLNSYSELNHLAENGITENSSNKKIYEQSEDIIPDSQKNNIIPLIQENESHAKKTKRKKNKKLGEKITYLDSDKCEYLDGKKENLTEKCENNSNELFGDSMICIDEDEFVDLAKEEELLVKKKEKHRNFEKNKMVMENIIIKEKDKQREQSIPYVNENEFFQFNEEGESHTRKNKSKRHKQLEEEIVCVDKNQLDLLDQKNENLKAKSNKKRKHEQFGDGISYIDNNQCVYLKEDEENLSKKTKRKLYRESEESILYVDKDELMQLNEKSGGHTKDRKGKESEGKMYIDKNQIVHLDEENKYPREKNNKNHEESRGAISFIADHESDHFAKRNLAKKSKRKKDRRLEENEIVMEKTIKMKEYKETVQSMSYVDKNGFIQLNEEGDSHTRKIKKKKHEELEEKKGYIDNEQFVYSDEEDKNLVKKRIKENKLEQSGDDISFIDNNALVNLDEDNEYFIKKPKKKKYRHLEENEIVMEKCQKKKENERSGESKKKKQIELQQRITHIDNNYFNHLTEKNESLTTKNKKNKQALGNISSIDSNELFHLFEENESLTGQSKKIPGQFEENKFSIDSNKFIDLVEENESLEEKSKKEEHKQLQQKISNIDYNELPHLHGENESIMHKTKKKTRCKQLEESISDNNENELMKSIEDHFLNTNTSSPILKKEKETERKISDKSKNKEDYLNIVKNGIRDDEEDIFSGIFKSESSRETIMQNVECENTTPLLKKNYSKERGDSVVIQEELSNNLTDNFIKNSPRDVPEIKLDNYKSESYTFSDILSQSHSDKLMIKFNDIVHKSNDEKSCSEPRPRSQKHVSKSQLKQRTLHDFAKPKIDLEEHQKKLKIIDMLNESKSIESIQEELDMPVVEEQRKHVEGLVIETDWPIPPIHRIAYFVNSCPSEAHKRALKAAGITWKLGKYTKEEDEKIIQNWANFCKVHNWNEENYQPFLKCSTKTKTGVLNQLQHRKFVHFLCRGFENRLMYSVYHRFQRLFSENDANTGRFTEEDDKIILEYVTSGNSNQPFAELVDLLKRSRLALIKRYKFIEMKNKTSDERVLWNKELTENLLANLIEVTRSVKLSELKDYNVTIQEWKKVSTKMNIPVKKLKRAWTLSLYPRLFSENYVTELAEVKKELVDLLYIKYRDWREVNWNEVAEQLHNKFSGAKLCKIMRDLIMHKVPPKKQNNLHQTLKYIRRHYQKLGMSRDRFKFVDDILKETRNVTVIPKIVNKNTRDEKSPIMLEHYQKEK